MNTSHSLLKLTALAGFMMSAASVTHAALVTFDEVPPGTTIDEVDTVIGGVTFYYLGDGSVVVPTPPDPVEGITGANLIGATGDSFFEDFAVLGFDFPGPVTSFSFDIGFEAPGETFDFIVGIFADFDGPPFDVVPAIAVPSTEPGFDPFPVFHFEYETFGPAIFGAEIVMLGDTGDGVSFTFDNLEFSGAAVPEPSEIAGISILSVLGLLAIRRRFRK